MFTRKNAAFSALSLGLLALAGCQQSAEPDAQGSASAPAEALGPDAKPGTSAKAGRMILPVVADRPAAVYFTFTNASDEPVALAAIHIAGADSAEMHKTEGGQMRAVERVAVDAGKSVEFAPGGLHVMAFDLDDSLKSDGTTEMTITFEGGDKLSMPLVIEKMGAGMHADAGMDHGAMDHDAMGGMEH
ncbi:MAG: copper chaperone PCu(A)C [Pseudomonadota bacterium]|nr:copper chaperone PCu(A)C [Pseudomonadota bacterium]